MSNPQISITILCDSSQAQNALASLGTASQQMASQVEDSNEEIATSNQQVASSNTSLVTAYAGVATAGFAVVSMGMQVDSSYVMMERSATTLARAQQSVVTAQENLTKATAAYGPNSQQAIDATAKLQIAEDNLTAASDRAGLSQDRFYVSLASAVAFSLPAAITLISSLSTLYGTLTTSTAVAADTTDIYTASALGAAGADTVEAAGAMAAGASIDLLTESTGAAIVAEDGLVASLMIIAPELLIVGAAIGILAATAPQINAWIASVEGANGPLQQLVTFLQTNCIMFQQYGSDADSATNSTKNLNDALNNAAPAASAAAGAMSVADLAAYGLTGYLDATDKSAQQLLSDLENLNAWQPSSELGLGPTTQDTGSKTQYFTSGTTPTATSPIAGQQPTYDVYPNAGPTSTNPPSTSYNVPLAYSNPESWPEYQSETPSSSDMSEFTGYQTGAAFTQPTHINAIVAEAGPEVLSPVALLTSTIQAALANNPQGGGGASVNSMTVQINMTGVVDLSDPNQLSTLATTIGRAIYYKIKTGGA